MECAIPLDGTSLQPCVAGLPTSGSVTASIFSAFVTRVADDKSAGPNILRKSAWPAPLDAVLDSLEANVEKHTPDDCGGGMVNRRHKTAEAFASHPLCFDFFRSSGKFTFSQHKYQLPLSPTLVPWTGGIRFTSSQLLTIRQFLTSNCPDGQCDAKYACSLL